MLETVFNLQVNYPLLRSWLTFKPKDQEEKTREKGNSVLMLIKMRRDGSTAYIVNDVMQKSYAAKSAKKRRHQNQFS